MLNWLFGKKAAASEIAPQTPTPVLPVKDATELLAEALAALRKEMRAEESRQHKEARDLQVDDEQRIVAATGWIQKAGLTEAIPTLVKAMWHYHAWLTRPGYKDHEALHLVDLSAEKTEGEKVKNGFRVKWRMSQTGSHICFSFLQERTYGPFDGSSFADASITIDDDEVLRVSLIHDVDKDQEYNQWRTVAPSVLKPGEWVADILEVEHRIRLARQHQHEVLISEYKRKQAVGLPPL